MTDLLAQILPYIPPSALPLLVAVVLYFKTKSERKEIGENRDKFESETDKRISVLEERVNGLDELKCKVDEMNKTLNELAGMFKVYLRRLDQ